MDYSQRLKWIENVLQAESRGLQQLNSADRNRELPSPAETTLNLPLKHISLFRPEHYEAGYAYPLVIWLHPDCGSEHDLHTVMPEISIRNYLGLSFRAPAIDPEAPDNGYRWPDSHLFIQLFLSQVEQTVEELKKVFHIHEDRIYLAGKGTGCSVATRLLLQSENLFAGAALLDGQFSKHDFSQLENRSLKGKRVLLDPNHAQSPLSTQRLMRLWKTTGADVQLPPPTQLEGRNLLRALDYWIMEGISTAKLA
ncbi:hypothetical protein Pan153_53950 [Gimesia panareensis]|uniref:Alpha/beta hydrolase family protein n=1 Tax=Gimesia panareensis TaxID=2527978 RepID=A0A518FWG6_9PLAN|nr:hypothetical protein [Gimesia panareensis]QDV20717.1 hypothetical protein Pan153_53950 [Gimesia panareensis]